MDSVCICKHHEKQEGRKEVRQNEAKEEIKRIKADAVAERKNERHKGREVIQSLFLIRPNTFCPLWPFW